MADEASFDPDAIMARYLADKAEPERRHVAPMAEAPPPLSGLPQRRTFGRKVA